MSRLSFLGLIFGLAGCGSFGAFDGFPEASDVSDAPWPRLVDTPSVPEDRLIASTGVQATERLNVRREASIARRIRADRVLPISESLQTRGDVSRSRSTDAVAAVDDVALRARATQLQARTAGGPSAVNDADLLTRAARSQARSSGNRSSVDATELQARAARLQARTAGNVPAVDDRGLQARAALSRARTTGVAPAVDEADLAARADRLQARSQASSSNVNESDLLARAALLRQRQSAQGTLNEADLSARVARNQFITSLMPSSSLGQAAPATPRPPTPLRSLDTPVISPSFEERARRARERAADL